MGAAPDFLNLEGRQGAYVSPTTRRVTKVTLLVALALVAVAVAATEYSARRAIEFRSAEELYGALTKGGFRCEEPFFPTGDEEPPGFSTASCRRGLATIDMSVNTRRGDGLWVFKSHDAYTSGEPIVVGRNWTVGFQTTNRRALALAHEVQDAVGGAITQADPPPD